MSMPIRILQVFARMDRGGAESMIMNLYRNIDRSKLQFDFIVHTSEETAFDKEIESLGGKIYRIPRYTGRNHLEYKSSWNLFFKNNHKYKIIHGHVRSTASIYLKIAKKFGLTTIAHSHSTSNGNGFSSLIKDILQIPIKYNADYLFGASNKAGSWLFGQQAIENDNFCILKNAIETEKYLFDKDIRNDKRSELGITNETVIGHIGSFKKVKNHSFLVDVFYDYHKKSPNSILVLVGDGRLKNKIQNKVNQYNLSNNVLFLGSRSDVNELLQIMDIFVFPSIYEGLPVTLIEAQAAGLKCIISDEITKEVEITNHISYLSVKEEPQTWSDKIKKIIRECNRKNDRKNMKKEVMGAGYDAQQVAIKLQNFYLNCT